MAGLIIFLLLVPIVSFSMRLQDLGMGWINTTAHHWLNYIVHLCLFLQFHCQSLGGHLASALTFDLPLTWIGGTDSGQPEMTQDGRWSWSDGSKFNYKNWAKGKPENFDPKHRWNDATCGMKFPSLCSLRTE
uniref:C-type lectin domain-containing protein n=1 Tax=Esox lucius TaxID=8010 RepID=A0AAY5K2E3_ESOLU